MSEVTVSRIRSWRPGELSEAAESLAQLASAFDDGVANIRSAQRSLVQDWRGQAADAAEARVDVAIRDARRLHVVLDEASSALREAGEQITIYRRLTLAVVDEARAHGWSVSDDGTVTAPPAPDAVVDPSLVQAEAHPKGVSSLGAQAAAEREAEALTEQLQSYLSSADAADQSAASRLADLLPPSQLQKYLERVTESGHPLLEVKGLAGMPIADFLGYTWSKDLIEKPDLLKEYLQAGSGDERDVSAARTARMRFAKGSAFFTDASKLSRWGRMMQVFDKEFLPLTMLSGGTDFFTGGGYHGARGTTTKVLGGSAVVAAAIVLSPIEGPVLVAAGGVLLTYEAWSLGNLAWDHRAQIGHAAQWLVDQHLDAAKTVVSSQVAVTRFAAHASVATAKAVGHGAEQAASELSHAGLHALHSVFG